MKGMPYCAYNHDYLETADRMRIERCIYFQNDDYSVSELIVLPLAKLIAMRRESAEAEREIYDWLKEQASAWEKQAGKTLLLDKAIKYLQTPSPKHTANQWEEADRYRHERSNAVYRMTYRPHFEGEILVCGHRCGRATSVRDCPLFCRAAGGWKALRGSLSLCRMA